MTNELNNSNFLLPSLCPSPLTSMPYRAINPL